MENTTQMHQVENSNEAPVSVQIRPQSDTFSIQNLFLQECGSISTSNVDELETYIAKINSNSLLSLTEINAMRSDSKMGMVNYWFNNEDFPRLRAVALRLFATPASSCESERVFSATNKIQTKDRSRLDPSIQCALIYLRSLHLSNSSEE